METTRSSYVLFSYDKTKQSHDIYMEKKNQLEVDIQKIKKEVQPINLDKTMISVNAKFSESQYITACYYRDTVFLGVQDKKTKEISFNEKTNSLVKANENDLKKLSCRLENGIHHWNAGNGLFIMAQQLNKFWEPLQPVMDKIVDYENELKGRPESLQQIIKNSGLYEQTIHQIVSESEKRLHPLIEESLENTYGIDVGSLGKRNPLQNMSSIEEDIYEKYYHQDIGSSGYVDQNWHKETHIEPKRNIPERSLQKRFDNAKMEVERMRLRTSDIPNRRSEHHVAEEKELCRRYP